uniref:Uncharacterized protein n=1 Tax=Cacopsylla melanoneura TaxID=428564 RepID=A0A8D9E7X7_9HEMI
MLKKITSLVSTVSNHWSSLHLLSTLLYCLAFFSALGRLLQFVAFTSPLCSRYPSGGLPRVLLSPNKLKSHYNYIIVFGITIPLLFVFQEFYDRLDRNTVRIFQCHSAVKASEQHQIEL